jgi:hypothetical protein
MACAKYLRIRNFFACTAPTWLGVPRLPNAPILLIFILLQDAREMNLRRASIRRSTSSDRTTRA